MSVADLLNNALEVLARPLSNRGIAVRWTSEDRAVQVRGVKTDLEQAVLFAVFYAMQVLEATPPEQRAIEIQFVGMSTANADDLDAVSILIHAARERVTWQPTASLSDGVQQIHAALARNGGHFHVEAIASAMRLQLTLPANLSNKTRPNVPAAN